MLSRLCAGCTFLAPPAGHRRRSEYVLWCAWQESNLLPFGPEPNALSGELQARGRFPSLPAELHCAVREQVDGRRGNHARAGGMHLAADQRTATVTVTAAESVTTQPRYVYRAPAIRSPRTTVAVPGV